MMRFLCVIFLCCCHASAFTDAKIEGDSKLEVNVGVMGYANQVVLPGSELTIREVDPRRTKIAVRIDSTYPHGDNFRYDLKFFGLEPGTHNLAEYLVRKDGRGEEALPEILVTVNSILPDDQFAPSPPAKGFVARIGGYHVAVILAIVGWCVGLLAILFLGRVRSGSSEASSADQTVDEVSHIKMLVSQAIEAEELTDQQKADLDMRILNFWRARRNITDVSVSKSLARLKSDEQAGPLLNGLERWFYSREAPTKDEIFSLLKPMSDIVESDLQETKEVPAAGEFA